MPSPAAKPRPLPLADSLYHTSYSATVRSEKRDLTEPQGHGEIETEGVRLRGYREQRTVVLFRVPVPPCGKSDLAPSRSFSTIFSSSTFLEFAGTNRHWGGSHLRGEGQRHPLPLPATNPLAARFLESPPNCLHASPGDAKPITHLCGTTSPLAGEVLAQPRVRAVLA